ncbi:MAG: SRPBCC family protein [Actinomycetota bacterium]|nr:SRPBCC family protein [Actinomycetota bacterium]
MRVEAATVIRATPEQVFRFIAIPENGPRWQESAVSTRLTTPGPLRLGSAMEHEGKWLRMRIPTTAIVTVYEPPLRYGYDITTRLFPKPSLMRYAVEPVAEGTKLTLSNEAPGSVWMKPFEPLLQRNVQAMFERDAARLKALIEAELPHSARAR